MLRISLYENLSCIKIKLFKSLILLKKNSFIPVFPAFYQQHFSEHVLMVTSVHKTLEDEMDNETGFYFCN